MTPWKRHSLNHTDKFKECRGCPYTKKPNKFIPIKS